MKPGLILNKAVLLLLFASFSWALFDTYSENGSDDDEFITSPQSTTTSKIYRTRTIRTRSTMRKSSTTTTRRQQRQLSAEEDSCGSRLVSTAPLRRPAPARAGEFPWLVVIEITNREDLSSMTCNGVIVSKLWVITSAHCFSAKGSNPDVKIFANLVNVSEAGQIRRSMSSLHVHPDFDDRTLSFDVAALRIDEPWNFTDPNVHIKPACLPSDCSNNEALTCLTAGWQTFSADDYSLYIGSLVKATVRIANSSHCNTSMLQKSSYPFGNDKMCVVDAHSDAARCQVDAGSGIFCRNSFQVEFTVYGLASFVQFNPRSVACRQNTHVIYANLCQIRTWLEGLIAARKPETTSPSRTTQKTVRRRSTRANRQ